MRIGLAGLLGTLLAVESLTVDASGLSRSLSNVIAKKIGHSTVRGASAKQSAVASSKATGAAARRQLLVKLDRQSLNKIESIYGTYIPAERLRMARVSSVKFLNKDTYQKKLLKTYPNIPSKDRVNVVGHYKGHVYVDSNDITLPRNVAHERIHQLGHQGYRLRVGRDLNEGTTEFLAARVYKDLHLQHVPVGYPLQRQIVEMMSMRVGKKRVARAYFSGRPDLLKNQLDQELGKGAFDKILIYMEKGHYDMAKQLLRNGLR